MNQNFFKVTRAQMLLWVCDALSAEISVLQNVPLHANMRSKLIENCYARHAVRSDANTIHAKFNFPKIDGAVEKLLLRQSHMGKNSKY